MNRSLMAFSLVVSTLVLALPAIDAYRVCSTQVWKASDRYDEGAYLLSHAGFVPQESEPTGAPAVVATLLKWQGQWHGPETSEAEVRGEVTVSNYTLADFREFAAGYGLAGRWLSAKPAALETLRPPFVAHIRNGGGRFVIVRNVRSGYLYATDPARGQVLYPLEEFLATWTGSVFSFPEPLEQPEEWR